MTKDVILSISGLHLENLNGSQADEPIEVITPANYFFRNGKHFILYDEVMEGMSGVTKNKIKISGSNLLEIKKNGITSAHMIFEKDKKNLTYYDTPFGQLLLGVDTTYMSVEETETDIDIRVEYGLDVNHEPLADCKIRMNIKAKEAGTFTMRENMKF